MKKIIFTALMGAGLALSVDGQALKVASNGNVGVGNPTPLRQLHVQGNNAVFQLDRFGGSAPGFLLSNQSAANVSNKNFFFGVPASGVNDGYFFIGDYGTATAGASIRRLVVDNDGDVIIGTTTSISDGYRLRVEGAAFKTTGGTSWNSLSDLKVKKNVQEYTRGLDMIMKLRPVEFDYNGKGGTVDGEHSVSVIAQELQEVAPEMVHSFQYTPDKGFEEMDGTPEKARSLKSEELLSINTSELQWTLVNAIKQQQKQIEEKDLRIEELENKFLDLEKRLDEIKTINNLIDSKVLNSVNLTYKNLASIDQNIPNPFNGITLINYTIPNSAKTASIEIIDIDGKLIKRVNLDHTGEGSLEVRADEMPSGTYGYRLIVDGALVGSHKMIKHN